MLDLDSRPSSPAGKRDSGASTSSNSEMRGHKRAVVQVEQVDMMCKMSRAHIMAILGQIDADSKIKELYLGRNDVSSVPERVLT